jgi:hypothetical protein
MNARTRTGHAGWWLRLALAAGLAAGALALHSVPAQAAPAGPETVLTGLTSQGFPSYFRISPNGKTIDTGRIALQMNCVSGAVLTFPDVFTHLRINANGRAHDTVDIPVTGLVGGGTYSGTDSMSAKLNGKRTRITGMWRLQVSYTFEDGTTDECDSGSVRFTDVR